ncbi:MAG: penicillin-binding transpeptidase domain-containing protein [Bryobacteraceae bacterium]
MYHRLFAAFISVTILTGSAFGTTTIHKKRHRIVRNTSAGARVRRASYTPAASPAPRPLLTSRHIASRSRKVASPWTSPTFAEATLGDSVDGEDLLARRAAVQALGPYNGAVIVADPNTGRILSVVNQKLAYQGAYEPCSTIKIVAALAGLSEGVINQDFGLRVTKHHTVDLTEALAHSNNFYFASVGEKLGYEKIVQYGQMFGLGERAGLNIEAEQPGLIADAPPSDGLGMMTSFGEGFSMTPMELAAIVSAVANGGTLYYLQHPTSQAEIDQFIPQVKRQLNITPFLTDIKPGMEGAVEYGTARRAGFSASEPIFGKTGTCTDNRTPTHLGWFGSYNEVAGRKLVVVVLLTGGHSVSGPIASGVAGAVYKNLSGENYFAQAAPQTTPTALISNHSF